MIETTTRIVRLLCYHLQISVRHARAGVDPGIPLHNDLGAVAGSHHDPSRGPSFMQRFISLLHDEHRKGHFPDLWDPQKTSEAVSAFANDDSTSWPMTPMVQPLPDVHTISGLQQALKMLRYRIAVDGDYGPETR